LRKKARHRAGKQRRAKRSHLLWQEAQDRGAELSGIIEQAEENTGYDILKQVDKSTVRPSRVPVRALAFRDKTAAPAASMGEINIYGIDEPRQAQRGQQATQPAHQAHLFHQGDSPSRVPGDDAPIAQHEPPGIGALFHGYRLEQGGGDWVGVRQNCQLLPMIDGGDDTRRPPAKSSLVIVNEHRAGMFHLCNLVWLCGFDHIRHTPPTRQTLLCSINTVSPLWEQDD